MTLVPNRKEMLFRKLRRNEGIQHVWVKFFKKRMRKSKNGVNFDILRIYMALRRFLSRSDQAF
jgi:hypothetical protein